MGTTVIAIDGPAGSGKSTTAKRVARELGVLYLDTGAMYRAITLKCLRAGVAPDNEAGLAAVVQSTRIVFRQSGADVRVLMDNEDVTELIRGDAVTRHVSDYCAPKVVRDLLVEQQRAIAAGQSVVCEGRDIGTVVFPGAQLKVYMVASAQERARRRLKDFERLGILKTLQELVGEIKERDEKDSTRAYNPLAKAADAEVLDTTDMTLDQQVAYIVSRAREVGMAETRYFE